jgi:hypothetical protein
LTPVQVCRVAPGARFRQSVDRNSFRSPCSDTLTPVQVCRIAPGARFRQSVDRNSFRSPCSDTLTPVQVCRIAPGARFRQSVDRNSFRSPCSDTLTPVQVCRIAPGARFRQSVDRNSFRSPCSDTLTPCPGLPCRARRPFPAERRPKFISVTVLRYVDPCPGLLCRARRPFPAERRPKFISVTVLRYVDPCPGLPCRARRRAVSFRSVLRYVESRSVSREIFQSVDRNSFRSPCSDTLTPVQVCRIAPGARFRQSVDRNSFSVTVVGARFWECSTLSNWFNLRENRCKCSISMSRTARAAYRLIAILRYVEPSSCASGGLKPWLRSGKPCGLDQPRFPPEYGKDNQNASPAGASTRSGRA